jgi:cytoskeletal protein CcmA (bactofilin family)
VFSKKKSADGRSSLTVIEGGRPRGPRGISMLADGCTFNGRMFLQGESRIGGKVEGSVLSDGHLTIEESAYLKGEVSGISIHLNGLVEGKIRVTDILHVSATGRVSGEIFAKRLIVDDGARIDGQLRWVDGEAGNASGPTTVQNGTGDSSSVSKESHGDRNVKAKAAS